MRYVRLLAVALVATVASQLCGCMASQNLRVEDRQSIKKVYIEPTMSLPDKPMIMTRGMGIGAGTGGAIGAIVASASAGGGSREDRFVHYLAANQIDVRKHLLDALSQQMKQQQLFDVVDSADLANATIRLDIMVYGVGYTANMFSHDYRFVLNTKATMNRPDGRPVWVKQIVENSLGGDGNAATWDDLMSKPEIMSQQLDLAAHAAARELVGSLAAQ